MDNTKISCSNFFLTKKSFFYRILPLFLVISFVFSFASCSNSISGEIGKESTWQTETNENNSSIRWKFLGDTVEYVNVINGEDTFSQNFNYSIDGNKLIFESQYATLTFETEIEGNIMTIKTESGETLIFKKQ
ncbi:MAG: hypothetical protein J6V36_03010 [Clostridia bacterium]|nr:hypothetical protein [Clostridia bacterium]